MLTVRHIRHWYEPNLPHAVFVNGFFAGMMRDHDLWIVSWFVAMPPLYKILSNDFFAIWLVRLVVIRKRYYKIVTS